MPVYECDQCGACCQGDTLIVEAYLLDVVREPRLLEADPHYRGKSFAEVRRELEDEDRCVLLTPAKPCLFLQPDGRRCGIYPTRPNVCVAMQAGDEQCQNARAAHGLLPLKPVSDEEVCRDAW